MMGFMMKSVAWTSGRTCEDRQTIGGACERRPVISGTRVAVGSVLDAWPRGGASADRLGRRGQALARVAWQSWHAIQHGLARQCGEVVSALRGVGEAPGS